MSNPKEPDTYSVFVAITEVKEIPILAQTKADARRKALKYLEERKKAGKIIRITKI